jgi:N-glycosylase/DNA lyase
MTNLTEDIARLRNTQIAQKVNNRLKEFNSFKDKASDEWFSELCFCILTANSKARTAIAIQNELGANGFINSPKEEIKQCIIRNKHRFHNNKSDYIVSAREWLAGNITGLGYKEASHFLRNIGYKNLAILDRHILNLMAENGYIEEKPASLSKKNYLEIEKELRKIADSLSMTQAELDLYMWYLKGRDVLK